MMLEELLGRSDVPPLRVADLVLDSREVTKGAAFVALRGESLDGHRFVREAAARGAAAILAERPQRPEESSDSAAWIVEPNIRSRLGELAARFFGSPASQLSIAGVTGTNGKTSVGFWAASVMPSTAFMGTIGWGFPVQLRSSRLTTEDPITLQRQLATVLNEGACGAVMEVSSHALVQRRVEGIPFRAAAFTNLTRDHLDYHESMEAYGQAKRLLFEVEGLETAVINIDDPFGKKLSETLKGRLKTILGFGVTGGADITWTRLLNTEFGTSAKFSTPWGKFDVQLSSVGGFAPYNAAAALGLAASLGADPEAAVSRLGEIPPIPGRMEPVPGGKDMPQVFVDYAHTPGALRRALAAIRSRSNGTLTCVFGCGGDRDRGKRILMAREVAQGADVAVVTSDNPRSECPRQIISDILAGFSHSDDLWVETDRRTAIQQAIQRSGSMDAVLIAGKGHEDFQETAGRRNHFSDREVAMDCMREAN